MGLITNEEAERKLTDPSNLFRQIPSEEDAEFAPEDKTSVEKLHRGGRTGQPNMTVKDRQTVGAISASVGPAKAAELTGVSLEHARQLGMGQVSGKKDEALKQVVEEVSETVREVALSKVMGCLNLITSDKLGEIKTARELSGVAKDMASVAKQVVDRDAKKNSQQTIIFYSPNQREEEAYEVVDLAPIATN
jgi:hypothetical protein|tara:strand:- start:519 stop:1094 length:576 start_codon:yes stop_codon:yes gene_type:complete